MSAGKNGKKSAGKTGKISLTQGETCAIISNCVDMRRGGLARAEGTGECGQGRGG